jgi:hypothetical protein
LGATQAMRMPVGTPTVIERTGLVLEIAGHTTASVQLEQALNLVEASDPIFRSTDARITKQQGRATTLEDTGLALLSTKFPNLTALDLSHCTRVTEVGFASLAALTGVVTLDLGHCDVTDRGLEVVCALPHLRVLNLTNCHSITAAGVPHLRKLSNIKRLDLSCCMGVSALGFADTPSTLANSAAARSLTELSLCFNSKVTDAVLCLLHEHLPSLESLELRGCHSLSQTSISHLSTSLIFSIRPLTVDVRDCDGIQWSDAKLRFQQRASRLRGSGFRILSDF